MTRGDTSPAVERLERFWWVRLPLAARHISVTAAVGFVDGLYLTARPMAAALAPPISFLLGLLFGWQHWGFEAVFSESLVFLMIAAVVGVMSANLGAMLLVGFALGDFLLAHPDWSHPGALVNHLLRVRVPLFIEYNLLGLLVVGIPLFTKALLAPLVPPARLNRQVRFGIALLGHLLLTAVLVFFWAQTVPILIRPVFTWLGGSPSAAAMEPLQQRGMTVVVVAALASLARMVLQGQTAFRSELGARVDVIQTQITSAAPVAQAAQRLPPWARVLAHTLWSTVLLSGMFESWLDALLLGALILFIQAARAGMVPVPLGWWPALVERVPLLFRLVGGFVILYLFSQAILAQQMRGMDSFRIVVVLTGIGMLILYLLAPGVPAPQPRRGGQA